MRVRSRRGRACRARTFRPQAPEVSPGSSESSRPLRAPDVIPLPFGRSARRTTDRRRERARTGDRDTSSAGAVSAAGPASSTRRSRARPVRTRHDTRERWTRTPTRTSSARASGGRFPELRSNRRHVRGTRLLQGPRDRRPRIAQRDSRLSAAALPAAARLAGVAASGAPSCGSVPRLLATTRRATSPRRRTHPPPVRWRDRFDGVVSGIRPSALGSVCSSSRQPSSSGSDAASRASGELGVCGQAFASSARPLSFETHQSREMGVSSPCGERTARRRQPLACGELRA